LERVELLYRTAKTVTVRIFRLIDGRPVRKRLRIQSGIYFTEVEAIAAWQEHHKTDEKPEIIRR